MDLTVIIPCFNDGGFLNRSVGSVCPQLAEADELIVVDDGSTDRTASVAAVLQRQFDHCRVRYVHQANAGVASARNHGLRLAEGRYVIFLDADDELLDGAITSYKQRITQDAPPWMISAHEWRVGNESSQRVPEVRGGSEQLFRKFLEKKLHLGNLSCMCISRDWASRHFETHLFPVPQALATREDATYSILSLRTETWRPSNWIAGSTDIRDLGIRVDSIEVR